jgi:hypothetical protein
MNEDHSQIKTFFLYEFRFTYDDHALRWPHVLITQFSFFIRLTESVKAMDVESFNSVNKLLNPPSSR